MWFRWLQVTRRASSPTTRTCSGGICADGSVDVYFGPEARKGQEKNSVITDPDKGFFVVFRFYGPTEGYIDKTWVLNDFALIGD